ncbi:MAG: nucleotidyl transferase AbiEii/AbiGii toxin family protein [Nitrospirota bacterium]|jgi:hypothetical protein
MSDNPLIQALKEVCLFLDDSKIEYMLVGGLAVGIWSRPRATVDIDFLISAKTDGFDILNQRLNESGKFVFIHKEPITFETISLQRATLKSNTDISVDFLFVDDNFKSEALKRKVAVQVADFSVNIATPEDLIILKLLSGRQQDRLDAEGILEMQKESLDMEYIKKWSEGLGIVY